MNEALYGELKRHGQEHLLAFRDKLSREEQEKLDAQLAAINWDEMSSLIREYVLKRPETHIPSDLSPAPYFPLVPVDERQRTLYERAAERGRELLRAGKVAALTVAGGQGTRLGFDGPKGTYPITPVKGKTLFRYFGESLCRIREKYGKPMKWYIMTSVMNHQDTVANFEENAYFGLPKDEVMFFTQGTMPAVGLDGKLLLGARDSLALAPDGHGGTLLALRRSGALKEMLDNGVEYISYFQVDNPLVSIANPLFLGLHDFEGSEMSAIMLAKTGAFEKLGNFCVGNGRLQIIEYSDMPEDLAKQTDSSGRLRFIAGSPAIHVISTAFVSRLTEGGTLRLPWHRADKKVPYVDAAGETVTPGDVNAVKLESFIFDALPLAEKTMVLEAARDEEFAPTKNKTGVDSVESCRDMLVERDARRLERAGLKVPRGADGKSSVKVELSPRLFLDDEDVAAYLRGHSVSLSGSELYIG